MVYKAIKQIFRTNFTSKLKSPSTKVTNDQQILKIPKIEEEPKEKAIKKAEAEGKKREDFLRVGLAKYICCSLAFVHIRSLAICDFCIFVYCS